MQVSSLLKFSAVCPFLGHSTTSSLRTLAGSNANNASQLTATAMKCPMMGPKLAAISQARTYASVAGNREVEEIHKVRSIDLFLIHDSCLFRVDRSAKGHPFRPAWSTIGQVPACQSSSRGCCDGAEGGGRKGCYAGSGKNTLFITHGCWIFPVPKVLRDRAGQETPGQVSCAGGLAFLDDLLIDRSYRYFNNINRLAAKFPVAHTANTKDEVDVWCSNDYLGMGRNPVVLNTMK